MAEYEIDGLTLHVPGHMLNDRIAGKLVSGGYEAHEARAVRMRVKPGQRVLELGAGLGYVSAVAARTSGPENVVSVEANPALLPVIERNLKLNGFAKLRLMHGAVVGQTQDIEDLGFDPKKAFWAGRIADDTSNPEDIVSVPVLALPKLLEEFKSQVVIMDVEGAERFLFDAAWPEHVLTVIMELHPKQYPDTVIKQIVDCMSTSGLTYDPGPSRGRILCFRRVRGI
ncbi:FkbM family methyltransferase [Roseovarius phycicola]|uniref:FkbM family methyltransferase n=1 Tax=Roseovarius phycicola TaxID=3080976 RepID=A0ABZ2HHQ4_9RHOB